MSALKGLKVIELEGIGPGPLGACVLADFGADVISVSRFEKGKIQSQNDPVSRGKRSIAINLKSQEGLSVLKAMIAQADVFIEPFRPGAVEKLGLGPSELCKLNSRLIYARMTGWGQGGDPKFEKLAGHDANYISISGALSIFRRHNETPSPPANFAGDYAGGGMMMAMGVLLAVIERHTSGLGQVIDAAMVDGVNYAALPLFKWMQSGFVPTRPDGNIDTDASILHQAPPWCQIFECSDKKWVSVQAIEPAFYALLIKGLGLDAKTLPHQYDKSSWPWMKTRFECIFKSKTRDEWASIFYGVDACVAPVLTPPEAAQHPHNVKRRSFAPTPGQPGKWEPAPAPKLSRTPGCDPRPGPNPGGDTRKVLQEYGIREDVIAELFRVGGAGEASHSKL